MAMVCYFVRHGAAADATEWTGSDGNRPLTGKGRKQMARVGRRLAKLGLEVNTILTSPLLRAKQTAELIAEALELEGNLLEDARLEGGFNSAGLAGILRDHQDCAAIMLVGHEPSLSEILGRVLGGATVNFKKGAVACVELRDSNSLSGELLWLAPPSVLIKT
jgi:phosphohistidine phosphatase